MLDLKQIQHKPIAKEHSTPTNKRVSIRFSFLGSSLSNKLKETFYYEWHTLQKAKLRTTESLEIIKDNASKAFLKKLIAGVIKDMRNGLSVSESFQKTNKFTPYEYYSMKIGEKTGRLDAICLQLFNYFKRKNEISKTLIGIIIYPIFLFLSIVGAWYFIYNYMIPNILPMYASNNLELPDITKALINISTFVGGNITGILSTLFLITVVLFLSRKQLWFQKLYSKLVLSLPVIGKLRYRINLTNALQLLHTTTHANASIDDSLTIIESTINDYTFKNGFKQLLEKKQKGVFLYQAMEETSIFNSRTANMVKIGEQTNQLEEILAKLVQMGNDEIKTSFERIKVLLPNFILMIFFVVIVFLFLATYLPMLNFSEII